MSQTLINGWLVSGVAYLLCIWVLRRLGAGKWFAIIAATPFFTSPLFIAIRGAGSYIFLFDFAVPFLVWRAFRVLPTIPRGVQVASFLLLFGAGIYPLMVSVGFAVGDRHQVLFMGISLYRLAGTIALMICATQTPFSRPELLRRGYPLLLYAVIGGVILGAVVLQASGFDTNSFYNWSETSAMIDEKEAGYSVLGLFRGSMGIVGMMGIAAALSLRRGVRLTETLIIVGAVCGIGVILSTTSKTSLFVALGTGVVAAALSLRQISAGKIMTSIVLLVAVIFSLYAFFDYLPANVQKTIIGVLQGDETKWGTWYDRQARIESTLEVLDRHPEIIAGLGIDPRFSGARWAYYHNEYIGIVMHGGIISFSAYIVGLAILGTMLAKRAILTGDVLPTFAFLVFVGGLVQGYTVGHLVPGIYYGSTVAMFGLAYGLGLHPWAIANSSTTNPECETIISDHESDEVIRWR
jgi:hypothetical protein